jgi:sialic acid synthase SpsE
MLDSTDGLRSNMNEQNIIKVDGFEIGGEKTFIIAEIGSNHNQSLDLAYKSIDAAIEAGANAVKFQSIKVEELYWNPSQAIKELHAKIDLAEEWHKPIKDYCDKNKITFFSSPTYFKAVDLLEELSVSLYKIASAQSGTFPQLVEKVAKINKPTFISTGLVSYAELEKIVKIFLRHNNRKFVILHCNSIYPTPYNKVNLQLMDVYKKMFDCVVGFSDHTDGIHIPIAAVVRGAKVIEKHFALDRNLPVPDAPFSLEPKEFAQMVKGIRDVEAALNFDMRTEIQAEELGFKKAIASRLILKNKKNAGDSLTYDDFDFKRHSEGIDCKELETVLQKYKLKKEVLSPQLLNWDMLDLKL